MSSIRRFRPNQCLEDNIYWQKMVGDNHTIELIPDKGVTSVFIKNNLQVGNQITVTSSIKKKQYISDIEANVDNILKLNPKQYQYIDDSKLHYGFIAEDVEHIYPNLVLKQDDCISLNYLELIPLLLNKIKDLQQQIDEIKSQYKSEYKSE